jgi:hypothetical protein
MVPHGGRNGDCGVMAALVDAREDVNRVAAAVRGLLSALGGNDRMIYLISAVPHCPGASQGSSESLNLLLHVREVIDRTMGDHPPSHLGDLLHPKEMHQSIALLLNWSVLRWHFKFYLCFF